MKRTNIIMVIVFTLLVMDMITTLYLMTNGIAEEKNIIIRNIASGNPWLAIIWFVCVAIVIIVLREILLRYDMETEYRAVLIIYSFDLLLGVINNINLM